MYKVNHNKIIFGGVLNSYIIDIHSLELETTIKLNKTIKKILVRPNGNIFVLTFLKEFIVKINRNIYNLFLNKIQIDFKFNEIIQNKEDDITNITKKYSSLFDIFNYSEKGLAMIIDNEELIIYNNYEN